MSTTTAEAESIFLSPADVARLTGFKTRAKQVAYLRDVLRIPFRINALGQPVVTRAAVLGQAETKKAGSGWAPPQAAR